MQQCLYAHVSYALVTFLAMNVNLQSFQTHLSRKSLQDGNTLLPGVVMYWVFVGWDVFV